MQVDKNFFHFSNISIVGPYNIVCYEWFTHKKIIHCLQV